MSEFDSLEQFDLLQTSEKSARRKKRMIRSKKARDQRKNLKSRKDKEYEDGFRGNYEYQNP